MMDLIKCWDTTAKEATNAPTPFHIHDCCELLYICQGTVDAKIVEKPYTLKPGQLVIISPLEGHSIIPIGFPYKRMGLHVNPNQLKLTGVSPVITSALERHPPEWNHVFDLNQLPKSVELIEEIILESKKNLPQKEEMQRILFEQLLLLLYRQFPDRFFKSTDDSVIEEARREIESNPENFISVKEMAEKYYYTPSHFIVRFKKHTGYTPQKYYNLCRMVKARRLLLDTSLTLSVISDMCGFSDLNSFVRCFRSTMNITPGKFREQSTSKYHEE